MNKEDKISLKISTVTRLNKELLRLDVRWYKSKPGNWSCKVWGNNE